MKKKCGGTLPCPFLHSPATKRPLETSYGVCGSAVSSPVGRKRIFSSTIAPGDNGFDKRPKNRKQQLYMQEVPERRALK